MADVTVEFGAVDVGLDKTLKTIQDEIKRLEGSVKSGNLPLDELQQKMREIGKLEATEKRIKAMGDSSAASSPKVDGLGKDIKSTGDKSEKMGEQSGLGFGKLAAAVGVGQLAAKAFTAALDAAFSAVNGTIQGFRDALDLGGKLSDLSAQTGESAGNLLLLQRAFDNTGSTAENVGPALAKLNKSIFGADEESQKAVAAFGRMGIAMDEMKGKTPTEQLALVASGIQSIEDPAARAATAMDVFGKSGYQLLPLLTNFSAEMADARDTVGSMAEIMNRRAGVFDAVSDRFKAIYEKVRDFAAGILDRALPAIDAITQALSRIDAAKIGQQLADAFLGGQQAMKGFQAAADAISIGKVGLAFDVFWESLKLQSMQTANEIYKRLIAAFESAGQFIAKIFDLKGALFVSVISSFEFLGNKLSVTIQRNLANALSGNWLTDKLALQLNTAANDANTAANKIEDSLKGAGGRIKDQFVAAGNAFPESFSNNYSKTKPLFSNIQSQQAKVAELEGQVTAATAATTAEREKQGAQTEAELARRQAIRAAAEAEAEAQKQNAIKLVELEVQINLAKANGNEELAKSLEDEKKSIESKEKIKQLTEEYTTKLGLTKDKAQGLAIAFVNAQNAVNGINNKDVFVTVTTKVNRDQFDDLLASIAAGTKSPKTVEVLTKVTGVDANSDWNKAYQTLQNMQTINKNFDVALKVSGALSLEELWQTLNDIPTEKEIQLAMKITGKNTFDEALHDLPRFAGTQEANLLLKQAGFENISELKNTLEGIPSERRIKLILESLGIKDLNDAKNAIDRILINNGQKASITAEAKAETTEAEKQFEKLDAPRTATVTATADTKAAQDSLWSLGSIQPTITPLANTGTIQNRLANLGTFDANLDPANSIQNIERQLDALPIINADLNAEDSINKIQSDLKKEVDVSLQSSEGTKLLGDITGFVEGIKGLVETLSNKLPVAALTA